MSNKKETYKALRVTQLDAQQIDNEIFNIIRNQVKDSLKAQPFSWLLQLEPEINAILRYILWKFSIGKSGVSIGQLMLNTKFSSSNGVDMNRFQKRLYGIVYILMYWIKERQREIGKLISLLLKLCGKYRYTPVVPKVFSAIESIVQALSFFNFITFIYNGRHGTVLERLLDVTQMFQSKPSPRYIDYEYMRKQMTWDYLSQTCIVLMPLIKTHYILKYCRSVYTWIVPQTSDKLSDSEKYLCAFCEEMATNPYCGSCKHVFCYYCLKGNIEADSMLTCPSCGTLFDGIFPFYESREDSVA